MEGRNIVVFLLLTVCFAFAVSNRDENDWRTWFVYDRVDEAMRFDTNNDTLLDFNEFSRFARQQFPAWETYNVNPKHVENYIRVSLQ